MKLFGVFFVHALFIVPWINPLAPGPSPSVIPWLLSLASTVAIIVFALLGRMNAGANPDSWPVLHRSALPGAGGWVVAGVLSSGIGLLQYFGAASMFDPWINQALSGQAFANLRQRNQFASLTSIALASVIWFAVTLQGTKGAAESVASHRRFWLLLIGGVLAVGNAASSSRTGPMQLLLLGVLCAVWGILNRPLVRQIFIVAGITYVVAAFALPWLAGLDLSLNGMAARLRAGDEPCASRLTLWSNVLHLIAQKPWFGWGWGELDYAHYATLYPGERFCAILDNAHNFPLQLAVELGLPVALLICTGIVWMVLRAAPWRATSPDHHLAWTVLALIGLHSMVEYPLWYGPFQMAVGLSVLLLWQKGSDIDMDVKQPSSAQSAARGAALRWSVALVILAAIAFAGWDYHRISQLYLPVEERCERYRDDTMNKVKGSWLFRDQVRFAELTTTPLTRANAEHIATLASDLLHYSPERRVIEPLIESLTLLRRDDEALWHMARYRAAFPDEFSAWTQTYRQPVQPSR